MTELELERTFLVRALPEGFARSPSKEIEDRYLPAGSPHARLRLRRSGERLEMTKKTPLREGDASGQTEETIRLDRDEYAALAVLPARAVRKVRRYVPCGGMTAEVDVFRDALAGLVLADFEFPDEASRDAFVPPAWCLADVTQEPFVAGGVLCGKSYADLALDLARYGYAPVAD